MKIDQWGAISDRIGCQHTFAAMFAVQAITLLLLAHAHTLLPALGAVSVILLCCGGGFGTMPSFNVHCFGTKFMTLTVCSLGVLAELKIAKNSIAEHRTQPQLAHRAIETKKVDNDD
jgi:nitrate/nitrite transporter NarK